MCRTRDILRNLWRDYQLKNGTEQIMQERMNSGDEQNVMDANELIERKTDFGNDL